MLRLVLVVVATAAVGFPFVASAARLGATDLALPSGIDASVEFGKILVHGDFNNDGKEDLAVGVPDAFGSEGRVLVYQGTTAGLSANPSILSACDVGTAACTAGTRFGHSLAVGRFNGDDNDDLAIGSPNSNMSGVPSAGRVFVRLGSSGSGVFSNAYQSISQNGLPSEEHGIGDEFGYQLAAGDLNGDGFDDLAVGVPGEEVAFVADAGEVHVIYGSATGLDASSGEGFPRVGPAGCACRFGEVLEVADTDGDGFEDIWVGVPNFDPTGANPNAGAVNFMSGGPAGIGYFRRYLLDESDLGGGIGSGDQFGYALTSGRFDSSGVSIAIGAPFENDGDGSVTLVRGAMGSMASGRISFSTGRFTPGVADASHNMGAHLASGDLDGDGFSDLLASSLFEGLSTWYGSPGGLLGQSDVIPIRALDLDVHDAGFVFVHALDSDQDGVDEAIVGLPGVHPLGLTGDNGHVAHAVFDEPLTSVSFWSTADVSFFLRQSGGPVRGTRLADERRDPASTTKIVLALVLMDAVRSNPTLTLSTGVVVSADHLFSEPNTCKPLAARLAKLPGMPQPPTETEHGGGTGLQQFDLITIRDLLTLSLVRSSNDASHILAIALADKLGLAECAGQPCEIRVVEKMNAYAAAAGMVDTHFSNVYGRTPHKYFRSDYNGNYSEFYPNHRPPPWTPISCAESEFSVEQGDPCAHFSTARDLTTAGELLLEDPTLAALVGGSATISSWSAPSGEPDCDNWKWPDASGNISNSNNFVNSAASQFDSSYFGVKTGTSGNGGNLVFAKTFGRANRTGTGTLLGSNPDSSRYNDVTQALANLP